MTLFTIQIAISKHPKLTKSMKPIGSQRHKIRARKRNTRTFRHVFSRNYGSWKIRKFKSAKENKNSRTQILRNFKSTNSTLDAKPKQAVEALFVEFFGIFVRRRFDIGTVTEFKKTIRTIGQKARLQPATSSANQP